ncbi:hypothetical protein AB2M62_10005 [Sphingomonas sp. MMS12-HWE2-04]|uniref:ATPase, T2SS/T4P/T4SS family n=1 Tax=Sphingomonas sp. MMS12-HWE2-04 TaxID=3234199 RepID=UPI00384F78B3
MQRHAETALDDAGETGLDMAPQLRRAVARAWVRPSGLIIAAGAGADETAAALQRESGAEDAGLVETRGALGEAIEAAEIGQVVAVTSGADAVGTIVALRRTAPDRFALAASLRLVIAQRPAARLCAACREPVQAYGSASALLGLDPGAILWKAEGCDACYGSGETGSVCVFEGVEIDAAMRRLIYDGADAPLLARHAYLSAPNLAAAARALARQGVIAPEEAVRISRG